MCFGDAPPPSIRIPITTKRFICLIAYHHSISFFCHLENPPLPSWNFHTLPTSFFQPSETCVCVCVFFFVQTKERSGPSNTVPGTGYFSASCYCFFRIRSDLCSSEQNERSSSGPRNKVTAQTVSKLSSKRAKCKAKLRSSVPKPLERARGERGER